MRHKSIKVSGDKIDKLLQVVTGEISAWKVIDLSNISWYSEVRVRPAVSQEVICLSECVYVTTSEHYFFRINSFIVLTIVMKFDKNNCDIEVISSGGSLIGLNLGANKRAFKDFFRWLEEFCKSYGLNCKKI